MSERMTAVHWTLRIVVSVALLIGFAGCSPLFPPLIAQEDGHGAVSFSIRELEDPALGAAIFYIRLQRDNYTLQQQVPYDKGRSITIENIAAGPWHVTVLLVDDAGVATHSGSDEVYVAKGQTSYVHIPLHPRPGDFVVTIDLGRDCVPVKDGGCLAEAATAGRLYVHPGVKEETDKYDFGWNAGDTSHTLKEISLPPGSYDFQVVLYRGTRIPSNAIFESFWTRVDIVPGHRTQVTWQPESGLLDVTVDVYGPPPPPRGLTASVDDGHITLYWDASPGAFGYRVYARQTVREAFQLVGHTDNATTMWQTPDANSCLDDGPRFYVVTAFNDAQYESLRSDEVSPCNG